MNPVHLRTLRAVVRTGSFRAAGRELGYTGPAVSQQIAALERELGTSLFERDAHSIRPTQAALLMADLAQGALGALQGFEDGARAIVGGTMGRIRIGSFPTASERLLPETISVLVGRHPGIEVRLFEGEPAECLPLLSTGELDAALVYRYSVQTARWARELTLRPIFTERLFLIEPEEGAGDEEEPVELSSYADAAFISTKHDSQGHAVLLHLCRSSGFEPVIRYSSNDFGVIRGLVEAGLGVAVVPAFGVRPSPGIRARELPAGSRQVFLATRRTEQEPTIGALLRALDTAAATRIRTDRGGPAPSPETR